MEIKNKFILAVPKKGRLHQKSVDYLQKAGLGFERSARSDLGFCADLNLVIAFLPSQDIALHLTAGLVDAGITGEDLLTEAQVGLKPVLNLSFGHCNLCWLAPVSNTKSLEELANMRIATSFPNITRNWLVQAYPGCKPQIHFLHGAVETACALGLADSAVDLVDTGETMRMAGLNKIKSVVKSSAVLLFNPHSQHKDMQERICQRLAGVVTADRFALMEYNIHRDCLKAAKNITPGRRSPTIMPLEEECWLSVKAMILKTEANSLIEQLKAIGAQDIFVYHIDNCRV